jgi:hypothetical protein
MNIWLSSQARLLNLVSCLDFLQGKLNQADDDSPSTGFFRIVSIGQNSPRIRYMLMFSPAPFNLIESILIAPME